MGGIWETVGEITVDLPPSPLTDAPPIAVRADHEAAPGVTLLGWDEFPAQRRPGETLRLTFNCMWKTSPRCRIDGASAWGKRC